MASPTSGDYLVPYASAIVVDNVAKVSEPCTSWRCAAVKSSTVEIG